MKIKESKPFDHATMIATDHSQYTLEECRESGFRDGRDGILFYPCTEWGKMNELRGAILSAVSAYASGYKAGRTWYYVFWGCHFNRDGDTRFDAEIMKNVNAFRALGRRYAQEQENELNGNPFPDHPGSKTENARRWSMVSDITAESMNAAVRAWGFDHCDFGVGLYPTIQIRQDETTGTIHFDYQV